MKKLITKDDWRKFFKSKKEMMEYSDEIAEKEFKREIKKEPNTGKVANRISLKKWIAIANLNKNYSEVDKCGYCFMKDTVWGSYCFAFKKYCIYNTIFTGFTSFFLLCNIIPPQCMIKRFQSPELLKLIKDAGKKK